MQLATRLLMVAALALALLAGWGIWRETIGAPPQSDAGQVTIGGPFALTDQNGHATTDATLRGRWTLLYFGYTNCPDACPTALARMARALDILGSGAAHVVPVFITVDPARDKPAILKPYLAAFGRRFVGLTGGDAAIAKVAKEYRVYYVRHAPANGTYAVDHSSVIYLLDPDGKFIRIFDDSDSPETIAADLKPRL